MSVVRYKIQNSSDREGKKSGIVIAKNGRERNMVVVKRKKRLKKNKP